MNEGQLYVCFSRAKGGFWVVLLSWLIRLFTGGKVNHAFVMFKDPHLGFMTLGANPNGVTYMPLGMFLESHEIMAMFAPKKDSLWVGLDRIKCDIDARYNWSGMLGMGVVAIAHRLFHEYTLHNELSDPNRLFCSEFVADLIRANGYAFLPDVPDDAIDPNLELSALEKDENFISVPVPVGDWNKQHLILS